MKPFCVIPARRLSKRLHEKNLAPLGGKPMLLWTVEAALATGVFDPVVVSTEDAEIAQLATEAGALAHRRPDDLAGDLVSATDVCLEAHDSLRARLGAAGAIVCLQPSSPLRSAADIVESWKRFGSEQADFLVSVTPVDPHYFHWAVTQDGQWWRMWFDDRFLVERPLLPPVYRPNGAIKIGRLEATARLRNFFGPRLAVHEMDESRSVHVATAFDLLVAETLLGRHNSGG